VPIYGPTPEGDLLRRIRRPASDKEHNRLQEALHENKLLKRRISALEKQLSRIDLTKHQNLRNLVGKQRRESLEEGKAKRLETAKKHWLCHKCGKDYLRIVIWDHPVKGLAYYRKCGYPPCQHRTEMKAYSHSIEGITECGELKEKGKINENDNGNEGNGNEGG
jgi:hypothetical protein